MNEMWKQCFKLVLEGISCGSLGIAAVITNSDGGIISNL